MESLFKLTNERIAHKKNRLRLAAVQTLLILSRFYFDVCNLFECKKRAALVFLFFGILSERYENLNYHG